MIVQTRKRRGGTAEEIIADLQRVSKALGDRGVVSQAAYIAHGMFGVESAVKASAPPGAKGSWNRTLEIAGLKVTRRNWKKTDVLHGIRLVRDELGREPYYDEYKQRAPQLGAPCVSAAEWHFGKWNDALKAFRESPFAGEVPIPGLAEPKARGNPDPEHPKPRPHEVGEWTGYPFMPFAPVYEIGVVALFISLAPELGFTAIQNVRPQFPDCLALRKTRKGDRSLPVHIEFELDSSNFAAHKHPHTGCALLVCWRHDWKECPSHIEVLCLKDYLKTRVRVSAERLVTG